MRKTPTEHILQQLEAYRNKGLSFIAQGGRGFILPRYWIFKWNGGEVCCTKTKHLRELLNELKGEMRRVGGADEEDSSP